MPFAGKIDELPGFQTPGSPKLDDRIFARPDGSLDFLFLADQPERTLGKEYQIDISWSFGPEIIVLATLHSSLIFPVRKAGPLLDLFLRVPRDIVYFWPGNYRLNGYELISGDEVFAKSLVVASSPRQVTQASPSLIRYTVGFGFSAPSQPAPPQFTGWPAPVTPSQWPAPVLPSAPDPRWPVTEGVRDVPIRPGTRLGMGSPEGLVPAALKAEFVDLATGNLWFKVRDDGQPTGWECPEPRS